MATSHEKSHCIKGVGREDAASNALQINCPFIAYLLSEKIKLRIAIYQLINWVANFTGASNH